MAAAGGRVGASLENLVDTQENAIEILIDLVIPESQDDKTVFGEMPIALRVPPHLRSGSVLAAIDFDDDPSVYAYEIEYVSIARRLPTKMKATFAPISQMHPQFDFLRRQRFPKSAGEFVGHGPHPVGRKAAHPPLAGEG